MPTYILVEDTQPVVRAIGVSHTACKDEFRQNLRSHSWSVFSFFTTYSDILCSCDVLCVMREPGNKVFTKKRPKRQTGTPPLLLSFVGVTVGSETVQELTSPREDHFECSRYHTLFFFSVDVTTRPFRTCKRRYARPLPMGPGPVCWSVELPLCCCTALSSKGGEETLRYLVVINLLNEIPGT